MPCILIVEDEPSIRELLDDFFLGEGFATLLPIDGREGVAIAFAEHPDVILLDVMLPVMDGVEAARRLKDNALTQDIPLVVMSANFTVLRQPDLLAADVMISKPFDLDELLMLIQSQATRDWTVDSEVLIA